MREIAVSTSEKRELVDITGKVAQAVADTGVEEGVCVVSAPHATAAILVLELDGAVEQDVLHSLSKLVPKNAGYVHRHGSDIGHGAAHVASALLGQSKALPVSDGRLALGSWQSIAFCELDGPRNDRKVQVQVTGR